jgi:hypothetical protein
VTLRPQPGRIEPGGTFEPLRMKQRNEGERGVILAIAMTSEETLAGA